MRRAPAVAVLFVLASTACDDEDTGPRRSKAEWIERADRICREETEARVALVPEAPAIDVTGPDLTPEQLLEVATYLEVSVTVADDTTQRFEQLGLPDEDTGEAEAILDERARAREEMVKAIEAARAGEIEEFRERYAKASVDYTDAGELAVEFGLVDCGQQP